MEELSNHHTCPSGCASGQCKLREFGIVTGIAAQELDRPDADNDSRTARIIDAHELMKTLCRDYAVLDSLMTIEENL